MWLIAFKIQDWSFWVYMSFEPIKAWVISLQISGLHFMITNPSKFSVWGCHSSFLVSFPSYWFSYKSLTIWESAEDTGWPVFLQFAKSLAVSSIIGACVISVSLSWIFDSFLKKCLTLSSKSDPPCKVIISLLSWVPMQTFVFFLVSLNFFYFIGFIPDAIWFGIVLKFIVTCCANLFPGLALGAFLSDTNCSYPLLTTIAWFCDLCTFFHWLYQCIFPILC